MSAKHDDQLVADISNLLSDESFHDVTIVLDNGVSVKGNKMVLSARSKFLMTKFKETLDTKELRLNVVSSKTALDLVLGYFYTGNMDYSSFGPSNLFDILKLTSYMELGLTSQIENYLIQEMKDDQFKLDDILLLINEIVKSKFDKVKDAVLDHLLQNIEHVSKLLEVKHIPQSFLENLLTVEEEKLVIKVDTEAETTEEDKEGNGGKDVNDDQEDAEEKTKLSHVYKFDIFVNWLRGNEDCDCQFKTMMIKLFDLAKFPLDALFFKVRASNFYTEKEILDALGMQMMDNIKKLNDERKITKRKVTEMKSDYDVLKKDHDVLKKDYDVLETALTNSGYYRKHNNKRY